MVRRQEFLLRAILNLEFLSKLGPLDMSPSLLRVKVSSSPLFSYFKTSFPKI